MTSSGQEQLRIRRVLVLLVVSGRLLLETLVHPRVVLLLLLHAAILTRSVVATKGGTPAQRAAVGATKRDREAILTVALQMMVVFMFLRARSLYPGREQLEATIIAHLTAIHTRLPASVHLFGESRSL